MSAFHSLQVASVRKETREAVAVRFVVPESLREQYRFEPGQYLTLRTQLNGEEQRRNCHRTDVPGIPQSDQTR